MATPDSAATMPAMVGMVALETPADIEATAAEIEARTQLPVLLFPKETEYFIGLKVPA